MKLGEIIEVVSRRLEDLKNKRTIALSIGDMQQLYTLDTQIEETEATLLKLKSLPA